MKHTISALLMLVTCTLSAQWVRPNQFPELDTVNDATFEVYSQRYGVNKKASMTTIKKFMDQNISISGDSICITRASGTQCIKLPAQAFTQSSQVLSVTSSNTSYTLPEDTIRKYDYVFLKYEATAVTANYTVTLPEPSVNYNGKTVDVYLHLSSVSGLQNANISSPNSGIQTNDNSNPINQTNYVTGAGLYRFVCTKSINASGYKWLLIAKPGAAIQTKRVSSIFAENEVYNISAGTFVTNDELSINVWATGFNSQIGIPTPDSSYLGKTMFFYPSNDAGYTARAVCSDARIIEFSGTSNTTVATKTLTQAVKMTCIKYNGVHYWFAVNLYDGNSGTNGSGIVNDSKFYSTTNDFVLLSDTVAKYNRIHISIVTSAYKTITLPSASGHAGKEIIVYPAVGAYNSITIDGSIIKQSTSTSVVTYEGIEVKAKTHLVSDGTNWKWSPSAIESVTGQYLIGRYSSDDGPAQEVNLGSGFSWNGNTLNVASGGSAGGYSLVSLTMSTGGKAVIAYNGLTAPTITTTSTGAYTINVPNGTSIFSYTISADTDDCAVDGSIDIKVQWASIPSGINSSKDNVFLPAVTVVEKATTYNVQQADYGGWQITHPTISSSAVTTRITGINGFSAFIIKGVF